MTIHKLLNRVFSDVAFAMSSGQKEYANSSEIYSNFDKLSKELKLDRTKILWVYAMKHKDGIASFINGHTSQREDVRGRINDLIAYLILLRGMIDEDEFKNPVLGHRVDAQLNQNVLDKKCVGQTYPDSHAPKSSVLEREMASRIDDAIRFCPDWPQTIFTKPSQDIVRG